MARSIQKEDLRTKLPEVLQQVLSGPVEITDKDTTVAVLLSRPEYEALVQRRGERGLQALQQLQNMLAEPTASGHDRALDRKAS